MCVVLGVGVISVFDAVAFLACAHRVSSTTTIIGLRHHTLMHCHGICQGRLAWKQRLQEHYREVKECGQEGRMMTGILSANDDNG